MTTNTRSSLRLLFASAALSTAALAAVPAHAGPLSFLKKAVQKELKETFEATTESMVESAMQTAVETTFKVEKGEQAHATREGFRQEGHTTVPTADEVQAPQPENSGLLLPAVQPTRAADSHGSGYQGGITVATGDINGDGSAAPRGKRFRQEGHTTVGTADDVLAPGNSEAGIEGGGLWNNANTTTAQAQVGRGRTQSRAGIDNAMASDDGHDDLVLGAGAGGPRQAGKTSQNGTTVETASEVQATSDEQAGLLLPAVQANRASANPQRAEPKRAKAKGTILTSVQPPYPQAGKTSQNGTTVASASEVQAPEHPQAVPPSQSKGKIEPTWKTEEGEKGTTRPGRRMSQNGTTVATASEVQAPERESAGLLLPAVQANRASARPQRGKLKQNGTTVATASEVQAPERQRD